MMVGCMLAAVLQRYVLLSGMFFCDVMLLVWIFLAVVRFVVCL